MINHYLEILIIITIIIIVILVLGKELYLYYYTLIENKIIDHTQLPTYESYL